MFYQVIIFLLTLIKCLASSYQDMVLKNIINDSTIKLSACFINQNFFALCSKKSDSQSSSLQVYDLNGNIINTQATNCVYIGYIGDNEIAHLDSSNNFYTYKLNGNYQLVRSQQLPPPFILSQTNQVIFDIAYLSQNRFAVGVGLPINNSNPYQVLNGYYQVYQSYEIYKTISKCSTLNKGIFDTGSQNGDNTFISCNNYFLMGKYDPLNNLLSIPIFLSTYSQALITQYSAQNNQFVVETIKDNEIMLQLMQYNGFLGFITLQQQVVNSSSVMIAQINGKNVFIQQKKIIAYDQLMTPSQQIYTFLLNSSSEQIQNGQYLPDQDKILCLTNQNQIYLLDQVQCDTGSYYSISQNKCVNCDPSCKTCTQQGSCSSCDLSFNQILSPSTKLCICQQNYYSQNSNGQCVACPSYCQNCSISNSQLICSTCPNYQNLNRNNDQTCTCAPGYYQQIGQASCSKCIDGCQQCNSNQTCQQCLPNYWKNNEGKCPSCPSYCQNCQISNSSMTCSSCPNYQTLNRNNDQTCSCATGYYQETGQAFCSKCIDGCQQCNSNQTCQQCMPNYWVNSQGKCQICPSYCQNCSISNTQMICSSCPNYQALNRNNDQTCSCASGYYNSGSNSCSKCIDGCQQCVSNQICQKCMPNYQLDSQGLCRIVCPSKQYQISPTQCGNCFDQTNCITCTDNGQVSCTQCANNSFLQQGTCVNQCGKEFYIFDIQNKICKSCLSTQIHCNQCSYNQNTQKFTCYQCQTGFQLSSTNICIPICQESYNLNPSTNKCEKCLVYNCLACPSSFNACSKCASNYFLLGSNSCVQQCPQNYSANNNKECIQITKQNLLISLQSQQKNSIQISLNFQIQQILELQNKIQININNISQNQYTYNSSLINNQSISINIFPTSNIDSSQNVTVFMDNQLLNNFNFGYEKNPILVHLYKKQEEILVNTHVSQQLSDASKAASTITLISMIPLTITGSFWVISSLLDICQLIYLNLFIDTKISSELRQFLLSQKSFEVPFFNYFSTLPHYKSIHYESDKIFEKYEYQGFILSNLGDSLSLLITLLSLMLILYLIALKFKDTKHIGRYLVILKNNIVTPFLVLDLLWSVYQDIGFSTILQMFTVQQPEYVEEYLNYFIFGLSLIFCFFPFALIYPLKYKKFPILEQAMGENLKYCLYKIFLYFRKFVCVIIAGGLQISMNVQIGMLIGLYSCSLIIILRVKPYKQNFYNYKDILQAIFFLASSISYAIMIKQSELLKEEEQDEYLTMLGWIIISFFCVIIISDFISCLKEAYSLLKNFIQKIKQNKNIHKIHPQGGTVKSNYEYNTKNILSNENFKQQDLIDAIEIIRKKRTRKNNKNGFVKEVFSHLQNHKICVKNDVNIQQKKSYFINSQINLNQQYSNLTNIEKELQKIQIQSRIQDNEDNKESLHMQYDNMSCSTFRPSFS
ncbi:hypothetical protein ABPG72_020240 [Tetrahymena utriculariae]